MNAGAAHSFINPSLVSPSSPIGVFDSGIGGLTVLRALRERLPRESFVYLGDTARLPYGTKSPQSIVRYATQAARKLMQHNIKCLVIACNTASAFAIAALREQFAPLPVLGVIEPGAEAGCRATKAGRIAVIATESTVRGGAYQRAILARRPDAKTLARACSLFVALAEEGWTSGPIVAGVAHRYLDELFAVRASQRPDTLVLGCTHFPVFTEVLRDVIGIDVTVVDSAQTTAIALEKLLDESELRNDSDAPALRLLATDGCERFACVGARFLDRPIHPDEVQLVDLG
ncbi:MAG TPA: glutamate racemase [Steroidobacteraceae bacterium]|nr:glutamate racemase [Steroidobacteraceae bacterium]